ncbi:unnamed protein product [Prunus armeniaca]
MAECFFENAYTIHCSPGFPRRQSLVRDLHLNTMEVITSFSAQGNDNFCIEDFVDKLKETSLEGSPRSRKLEVALGDWLVGMATGKVGARYDNTIPIPAVHPRPRPEPIPI